MVFGHIVEAGTGNTIRRALISFTSKNGNTPEQAANHISCKKLSAFKGGFRIKNLEPGEYFLTVTKKGYNTVNLNVDLTDNEINRFDIRLEKTA